MRPSGPEGGMKPYFSEGNISLYCGDSRELIPQLPDFGAVITDPVWPNATAVLAGTDDPEGLLRDVLKLLVGRALRVVIQLGRDSDPRSLDAVPDCWPLVRA